MSPPLLTVTDLCLSFGGVRAVDGVSFTVAAGERVALIGPNGAGKSTCFNLIGGHLRPDRGTIHLAGRPVTGLPPRALWRRQVGRTFQIARPPAGLTVMEAAQLAVQAARGRALHPLAGHHARREEARWLLKRVDLADLAGQACTTLSHGDRKRLDLALALAGSPRLLLMDEPTAGMAPGERAALMTRVAAEGERRGMGVLFTEHDMDVVFDHAHRVLVMAAGRLVATGSPAEVRLDPTVRAVYMGDADALEPREESVS